MNANPWHVARHVGTRLRHKARGEFRRARSGVSATAHAETAARHLAQGEVEAAKLALQDGVATYPDEPWLLHQLAHIAHIQCEHDVAADYLTRMIELQPGRPELHVRRSVAAMNLADGLLRWRDLQTAHALYLDQATAGDVAGLAGLMLVVLRQGDRSQLVELLVLAVDELLVRSHATLLRSVKQACIWLGDVGPLREICGCVDIDELDEDTVAELADCAVVIEDRALADLLIDRLEGRTDRLSVELQAWQLAQAGACADARQLLRGSSYPNGLEHWRTLATEDPAALAVSSRRFSPSDIDGGVVLLAVVRDELARLPEFMDHYRVLGVSKFIFVDNGSTDGTHEWLATQSDVHLYSANGHYRSTGSGRRWINTLIERYCGAAWSLVVDADEFLIFPGDDLGLSALIEKLDAADSEVMFAAMLDMHGTRLDSWTEEGHGGLAERFPWFEGGTQLIGDRHAPYLAVAGGLRNAKLGSVMPEAQLSKPVLLKGGRGIRFLLSHVVEPAQAAPITGALLHYKFAVDPADRLAFQSSKGTHARRLASPVEDVARRPLVSSSSVRLVNADQLRALGLVRRPEDF